MNGIELFAGSCTFKKEAQYLGHKVFAIDIKPFNGVDLVKDMEYVTINDLPYIPDFGWFSPPCTTYSIAAISRHRDMGIPKTEFAKKSDKILLNSIKLINDILKLNPNFKWYIENPRGYLRKMHFMIGLPRVTVWYCQYGDTSAKPTDIWSNNIYNPLFNSKGWNPRPECKNGNNNCHHDKQPRGYKAKKESGALGKGTQGKKDNYERSKLPVELCKEIVSTLKDNYEIQK